MVLFSFVARGSRRPSFRPCKFALLAITALTLLATDAHAVDAPRVLEAARASGSIAVDARLDEPDWERAEVATGFVQIQPEAGMPASQPTEVRVLYGATALYVAAVLYDDPQRVRRSLSRRDVAGDADVFSVTIDGSGTGRSAFMFGVTAAGVQLDAVNEHGYLDYSWDAVWESAVRHTHEGWIVEMAIPYSMLRFPRAQEQTWWIQFERVLSRNGERVLWEPVSLEDEGMGFIAGRLTGMRGIAPRANVQVRPYTLSRMTHAPELAASSGYYSEAGFDVGADIKVSLGSDLIFDAAINPDFGQVEADPAVLNLTTFETFFPERRPFFLEGVSIFDYIFAPGDGPMLYTRRIGGLGRIVGAGKLTGRIGSGLSFGVLSAVTSDGFEDPDTYTGEDFQPDLVYAAARLKREFGDRSFVGAAVTYFDGFGGDYVGDHLRSLVAGTDWDVRLSESTYRWDGALTVSHRHFAPEFDLRDRNGFALYTGLDKVRGLLTGGLGVRVYSDRFDPNDVGFFRENNIVRLRAGARRLLNEGRPFGPFRLAQIGADVNQTWTFRDRTNLGALVQWNAWFGFRDYQRLAIRGTFLDLGGVDVRESRGMGPVSNLRGAGLTLDYSTDTRRSLVLNPVASGGLYEGGGTAWSGLLAATWTASPRLALSLRTRYEQRDNVRAWVANETFRRTDDGFALGETPNLHPLHQGQHHPLAGPPSHYDAVFNGLLPALTDDGFADYYAAVFGSRDQRSVDTSLRANYTLRPNLSFELYSQLFAARFRYDDFRVLAGPDDLRELDGYPRRRDEAHRALNLNAVARWEYRPGSTLFLVWSQARLAYDGGYLLIDPLAPGASPFDRGTLDLAFDTFEVRPTNVVLIKLNYLLMR
jgi:hypothetical protein